MKAVITRTSSQHDSIEAKTDNDILIVFSSSGSFYLDDAVEFEKFRMDGQVKLHNVTQGTSHIINIQPNNVHDLRLPMAHDSNRTPSMERLRSA